MKPEQRRSLVRAQTHGVQIHVHEAVPRDRIYFVPPRGPCPKCGLWGCPDDPRQPIAVHVPDRMGPAPYSDLNRR